MKSYDRLIDLAELKQTAIETIMAAADIDSVYAYGILHETERLLDIHVSRAAAKKPPTFEGEIKNAGMLFTRAFKTWKIYRPQVLRALNAKEPAEIKDFDAAWKALEEMAKREKFGGQEG